MAKYKNYSVTKTVKDDNGREYIIYVYGEVKETKELDGIEVRRVRYQSGTGVPVSVEPEKMIYRLGDNLSPTKELNFGWAICSPDDVFDEAKGILLAKKRFSKAPIRTQDCRFLKEDMVLAILNQTAEYVAEHEFKAAVKKYEAEKNFYENFRDGEIVKLFDGCYAALDLTNPEHPSIRWVYYGFDGQCVIFNVRYTTFYYWCKEDYIKNVKKATDEEEKAKIAEYLKEHYGLSLIHI